MGWMPPPDGIESCQGGGVLNHLREEALMDLDGLREVIKACLTTVQP